jgi:transposase
VEEGRLWSMYHEIVNLRLDKLKTGQIIKMLNISKNTFYRYLKKSPEEFSKFVAGFGSRAKKLNEYEAFVRGLLEKHPDFSSPQIQETQSSKSFHPILKRITLEFQGFHGLTFLP